jgi:indole-3-glycerol phosphate synthase
MSDVLQRICADKRREIALAREKIPIGRITAAANRRPPARGFRAALAAAVAAGGVGLIAEIKKASPSKGLIRGDFDPGQLAAAYQAGGAACLSVLTDGPYFQGAAEHLTAARNAASLPVLRKDFMLEPYQVAEARAMGADCILLIMAALEDGQASELAAAAAEFAMDILIEVHDRKQLERAIRSDLGKGMIGINNRNLKTMEIDLAVTEELAPLVPQGLLVVSESGIGRPRDLKRLAAAGVNCFLVGGSLMQQNDVEAATRALLGG